MSRNTPFRAGDGQETVVPHGFALHASCSYAAARDWTCPDRRYTSCAAGDRGACRYHCAWSGNRREQYDLSTNVSVAFFGAPASSDRERAGQARKSEQSESTRIILTLRVGWFEGWFCLVPQPGTGHNFG